MNDHNGVWRSMVQAFDQVLSAPKVSLAAAAGTTAIAGVAREVDLFTDVITKYTIIVGALTGTAVLAIQLIKMIRVWKAWKADAPEPEDLK